jgi:hypothetical protein
MPQPKLPLILVVVSAKVVVGPEALQFEERRPTQKPKRLNNRGPIF